MSRWSRESIDDCQGDQAANGACPFYPYRMGRRPPIQIFQRYCLYCAGGDREYVRECPATSCPAYPYRFGTNPKRGGLIPSQGTLEALKNSRRKARETGKFHQISTIAPEAMVGPPHEDQNGKIMNATTFTLSDKRDA